jgi:hypothetical protein
MATAEPTTLVEAVVYFSNPDNCLSYLVARRWPNGVTCPTCGSKEVGFVTSRRVWQCKTRHPNKAQFSVKLRTIFEDSPLGLDKWLPAMWMIASNRNGISSWELHRAIGVTQKTAWFMLHRIRLAMQDEGHGGKIGGEVEVDETYIGGKARNMHKERKARALEGKGGGYSDKTGVQGILQRGGKIKAMVVADSKRGTLVPNSTSRRALTSSPTSCKPTSGSRPTMTTKSSITWRPTSTATFTPTGSRTSGGC